MQFTLHASLLLNCVPGAVGYMNSASIIPTGRFMAAIIYTRNVEEIPGQSTVVCYKLLMNGYIRVT